MNLSDHATFAVMRIDRAVRLLTGAAFAATLASLPRLAQAAGGGGEAHVHAVVTAFAVLVAAAIVASIVAARSRHRSSAEAEPDERTIWRARTDTTRASGSIRIADRNGERWRGCSTDSRHRTPQH